MAKLSCKISFYIKKVYFFLHFEYVPYTSSFTLLHYDGEIYLCHKCQKKKNKIIAEGKETQKLDQTFLFLYHDVMNVNADTHNAPCLKPAKRQTKYLLFKIKAYY